MTDEEDLIFLGACILVRDPDAQLERMDSIATEAIERAFLLARFMRAIQQAELVRRLGPPRPLPPAAAAPRE